MGVGLDERAMSPPSLLLLLMARGREVVVATTTAANWRCDVSERHGAKC